MTFKSLEIKIFLGKVNKFFYANFNDFISQTVIYSLYKAQKYDFSKHKSSRVLQCICLRFFDKKFEDIEKFCSFFIEVGLMRMRASYICLRQGCITLVAVYLVLASELHSFVIVCSLNYIRSLPDGQPEATCSTEVFIRPIEL